MHLQGTKPWTPAATAYSAVEQRCLAAATLSNFRLATIRDQAGQPGCLSRGGPEA